MRKKVILSVVGSGFFLLTVERCAYNDTNIAIDCSQTDLAVVVESTKNATSCKAIDGEITVSATGGLAPYDFNINGGEYQTSTEFIDLGAGTYTIRVKDMNNCWKSQEVTITADGSNLAASASTTPDNQCSTNNGSITVTASGGTGPYQYQLDAQGFGTSNSFSSIGSGIHVVLIKDFNDCQTNLSVTVPRGTTGTSYATTIEPILEANCNLSGCHGTGTGARDWTIFNNVKTHAANIKTRTGNRSMPPGASITQAQIELIACWVDDGAPEN